MDDKQLREAVVNKLNLTYSDKPDGLDRLRDAIINVSLDVTLAVLAEYDRYLHGSQNP